MSSANILPSNVAVIYRQIYMFVLRGSFFNPIMGLMTKGQWTSVQNV